MRDAYHGEFVGVDDRARLHEPVDINCNVDISPIKKCVRIKWNGNRYVKRFTITSHRAARRITSRLRFGRASQSDNVAE